jgi:hypothetical protein
MGMPFNRLTPLRLTAFIFILIYITSFYVMGHYDQTTRHSCFSGNFKVFSKVEEKRENFSLRKL